MEAISRFGYPSGSLMLGVLLKRARGVPWLGCALALFIHIGLSQLRGLVEEQRTAKPLTTHFVKRQPRLSKPLELKKRPRPKRRQIQRTMVAVRARAGEQRTSSRFQPVQVVQQFAKPSARFDRAASLTSRRLEPQAIAQSVAGTKETKEATNMSLEMLDIQALDTGQYHAMVVQDPTDKRNVQGFCHLAAIYIPRIHEGVTRAYAPFGDFVMGSLARLAAAMNQYTDVRTDLKGRLLLGDSEMLKTPWIFLFIKIGSYELSDPELQALGQYLIAGGFVFADAHSRMGGQEYAGIEPHQTNLLASLRYHSVTARPETLPNSHPIYHCYFDFQGPPPAGDAAALYHKRIGIESHRGAHLIDHLDGIIVNGRLLAILTEKGYYHPWATWRPSYYHDWCKQQDPTLQLQFGVNLIIFSLIQEGSITHRVMNTVGY